MAQRTYEDACRIALTMDLVGERWALLVVRELIFGPKRFRDLRVGLPKASQNVLSQRLRELEEDGIVRRVELGPPVSAHVYELTERGRQLEPVLIALSRWGASIPAPQGAEASTDAFMFLFKALPLPPAREVPTLAVRLVVGADSFDVEVSPTSVEITRGARAHVQATVRADVATLWELIFTDLTVAAAVDAGTLDLTGDRSVAQRFFTLFGSTPT
ncbi:winged helix-turn-helix transcriptional regulator [Micromonospora sp. NPDC050417]|uniref:winged helix-turn-helix transcriptional regulator n=1 Tax=Micromonospora sp. NPDC050417 TaxID=3364280 RepID=UPI0037BDDA84